MCLEHLNERDWLTWFQHSELYNAHPYYVRYVAESYVHGPRLRMADEILGFRLREFL